MPFQRNNAALHIRNNPVNRTDAFGLQSADLKNEYDLWECEQDENKCQTKPPCPGGSWAVCYANCIDATDPVGNMAEGVAGWPITKKVRDYIKCKLPTFGSRRVYNKTTIQTNRAMKIQAAYTAGASYGCMAICAEDPCAY
jgi:hypothetical protein